MSDIAVIYKSRYGFTERYAQWIAEELSADLLNAGQVKSAQLQRYKTIIFGGGLYAGGVNGLSLLTKNFERLNGKTLYLFTVGVADVTNAKNTAHIRGALARRLTPAMLDAIHLYHLRGGLQYSKMRFLHKTMMGMLRKMLLKKTKNERSDEDRIFLETYGQDVDFVDRDTIAPLVADVKQQTLC